MISEAIQELSRPRSKGGKRARTRAKLIEAARTLLSEKGYEHTTLEDVARRAGMTSGAIYGNFKNRDELFIAVGQAYWVPIKPRVRLGASFAEQMRALAEATIAAIPERELAAVGRLTGMAFTLTKDEMRAQMHKATAASYTSGAAWLRSVADEGGLPMPAEILVRVIHAMIEGLIFQRLMTPELVPDEVFHAAFAALAVRRESTLPGDDKIGLR